MEEQNSFDEFFRESLADYRETPPPAAWETVAARLDDDDRRRRRGFFYWPWIALSLLLLVGGAWWLYGWINGGPAAIASGNSRQTAHYRATVSASDASGSNESRSLGQGESQTGIRVRASGDPVPAKPDTGSGRSGAQPVVASNTGNGIATGNTATGTTGTASALRAAKHPAMRATGSSSVTARKTQAPSANAGTRSASPGTHTQPAYHRAAHQIAGPAAAFVHGTRSRPATAYPGGRAAQARPELASGTSTATRPTPRQQAALPVLEASRPAMGPVGAAPAAQAMPAGSTGNERLIPASGLPALAAGIPTGGMAPVSYPIPASLPAPTSALPFIGQLPAGSPGVNGSAPAPLIQPGSGPQPASPAPIVFEPEILMLAIEPVMHFFAGAALPPVIGLYETGLLEPERYQPPVEPVIPVAAIEDPAGAPAMLPPDSSTAPAKTALSLSAFLGYERGIKTPPRNMFTLGLSLIWQLSEKLSIGVQPALLYGNLPRTNLTGEKAYQRSSTDVTRFLTRDYSPSVLGEVDTVNNYVIREAFDSIIVRGTYLKGSLWQLELPLILQLNPFGPAFRIYGGPSMHFGGSMKIYSDGPTRIYTIDRKDSVVQSARMSEEQLKNYFGKSNLESYKNYDPNAQRFDKLDPVRFGYQFGIGFQKNRMSVDLSVRQQLSGYHQLSPELRQLYMNPVFRFGFGYLLIPQRVKPAKSLTP